MHITYLWYLPLIWSIKIYVLEEVVDVLFHEVQVAQLGQAKYLFYLSIDWARGGVVYVCAIGRFGDVIVTDENDDLGGCELFIEHLYLKESQDGQGKVADGEMSVDSVGRPHSKVRVYRKAVDHGL